MLFLRSCEFARVYDSTTSYAQHRSLETNKENFKQIKSRRIERSKLVNKAQSMVVIKRLICY